MGRHMKYIVLSVCLLLSLGMIVFAGAGLPDNPLSSFDRIETFINSNKYTQPEDYKPVAVMPDVDMDAVFIETALGVVAVNPRSLSFSFTNENGYRWSSTVNSAGETLPIFFLEEAASALVIESFNTNNPNYALTKEHITKDTNVVFGIIDNGFTGMITFNKSRIKITVEVVFTEEGITVNVPREKIEEPGAFRLATITVYPYFGAVKGDDVPGYVFVPDGIGALVRYEEGFPALIANYQKEIYDRAISYNTEVDLNKYVSSGTRIYAPVFGFVHGVGQNAVFARIENGAEYGNINIFYPNFTLGYTSVFARFVYRRTYNQPMNRAGDVITLLTEEANSVDIKITYNLLIGADADYIGMARLYRDELDFKDNSVSETIPLRIETIGLEKTEGVLFSQSIKMTDFKAFTAMIDDLKTSGINNINATYSGFASGGYSWSAPDYRRISDLLGGERGLRILSDRLAALYLKIDVTKASSKSSGYNRYRDLSKKVNEQLYEYRNKSDVKYLLRHEKTAALIAENTDRFQDLASGLAYEALGSLLYYDYNHNSPLSNQISLYREALRESTLKTALYGANDYLWDMIDAYFDFPMYSSQYLPFSDTVPFMAIVLGGRVDLFAAYANFYPYARDELLRLIDFGVYPSFIVTDAPARKLVKTDLSQIYSSEYDVLKQDIKTYYRYVGAALDNCRGSRIVGRVVIGAGVVLVSYDNGAEILINYTDNEVYYGTDTVPPKHYLVLEEKYE